MKNLGSALKYRCPSNQEFIVLRELGRGVQTPLLSMTDGMMVNTYGPGKSYEI